MDDFDNDLLGPTFSPTVTNLSVTNRFTIAALSAKLFNSNCHPLDVVSRYRDTQHQVGDNYAYLFNLGPIVCII